MIQKRLAASILNCSPKRIVLDPEATEEIKEAITKVDVRSLIKRGLIKKLPVQGISRARRKHRRKRGPGSMKGKKTARLPRKTIWKNKIRLQRKFLRELKDKKAVSSKTYRTLYLRSNGGFFRSRRHIAVYIDEHGLRKK